jgi:hypothetical protein
MIYVDGPAQGLFPDESDPVKNEMADAVLATPAGRDQEPEREVPR